MLGSWDPHQSPYLNVNSRTFEEVLISLVDDFVLEELVDGKEEFPMNRLNLVHDHLL